MERQTGREPLAVRGRAPAVEDNVFAGNTALEGGGVRFCFFLGTIPEPSISRNTVLDNEALTVGGGIAIYDADPVIVNCTLDGNSAGTNGGGVHAAQCATAPILANTIVSNSASGGGVAVESAVLTTSLCNVWGNDGGDYINCAPGPTDMSADPLFCSPDLRNVTLRDDSPCLPENNAWSALIGAHEAGGCGTSVDGDSAADSAFRLGPPFPNPSRGNVTLCYEVANDNGPVELTVLTVGGRVVRKFSGLPAAEGRHEVVWDTRDAEGRPVAAGAYLIRGEAAGHASYRGIVVDGFPR